MMYYLRVDLRVPDFREETEACCFTGEYTGPEHIMLFPPHDLYFLPFTVINTPSLHSISAVHCADEQPYEFFY